MYAQPVSSSPPGMLAVGPNYSYGQSVTQRPIKVTSPQTGAASMAAAMINGYSDYMARQNGQNQPMQLPGGQQDNVFSTIANLFTPQATPSASGNDQINSGLY